MHDPWIHLLYLLLYILSYGWYMTWYFYLFCRIKNSIKGKTQPYIYFGRLEFFEYEKGTKNPVHIIFNNIDHDDDLLLKNEYYKNIIEWKSENKTTQIDLSKEVSPKRKNSI